MSNSTDTFWDVDGVSLQTLAHNITTWGGSRQSPPPLRGGSVQIGARRGRLWTPKVEDSRTMTLQMWVNGANDDGGMPTSGDRRAEFEHNWSVLRKLLWTPRRQITLTKRFRLYGETGIRTAIAKAQYAGGLDPTMVSRDLAVFSVDLTIDDVYFFSAPVDLPLLRGSQTNTFEYLGDGRTTRMKIDWNGTLNTGTRLTNVTDDDTLWCSPTSALPPGGLVSMDVDAHKATTTPSGAAAYKSSGRVSHGGDAFWMAFDPGYNKLSLGGSPNGSVQISFQEAWL